VQRGTGERLKVGLVLETLAELPLSGVVEHDLPHCTALMIKEVW
jgi:hypothetical protein